MGRQLKQKDRDIEFHKHHPSCVWGLLHILDYHHRNSGKKSLHCRKRNGGKVLTCCEDPKTDSLDNYAEQLQRYLDADEDPLFVGQDIAEATSAKTQTKTLITRGMSGRLGLQSLELSRHVGSSRNDLSETKTDLGNPIIILQSTADLHVPSPQEILQQRLSPEKTKACTQDAQSPNRETSRSQLKDCVDVLEILQVNKKQFLEILHGQKLPIAQTLIPKGQLKKSDSFPMAKPSHLRSIRLSTLEHKQKEIWSFAKVSNVTSVAQSPKFFAPESTENTGISKSVEVKDAGSGYASDTQEPSFYSSALSRRSRKHWWHPSIKSYFAGIKKKVKHALKHNKKENGNTIVEGIPIEVPCESRPSNYEKDESLEGIKSSSNDLGKVSFSLPQIRRASSLSESMDRYTKLFEHSFSNKAPRHQYHSQSLRLTLEDRSQSSGYILKTSRRRLSLPDLNSLLPFLDEASNDYLKFEFQNRAIASSDTNAPVSVNAGLQQESVDASAELAECPECERNTEVEGEISENNGDSGDLLTSVDESTAMAIDLPEEQSETHQQEQLASTINSIQDDEGLSPVSVLHTRFQDDISGQPAPKGSKLDECSMSAKELQSFFEDSAIGCNPERAAEATSTANTHFLGSNLNRQDDPALDYVRNVLDLSGFLDQDFQPTWYSLDQPLSPNLFNELEIYSHPQEDFSYGNDHQLLFDLVNDALLKLFESSLAYFPKQFSFAQSMRRAPKGNHVLEEVWKRISWHQSSSSTKDQSLNDIVARDMAKGDGWMNVLLDVEDVALDMEEIIFDELLDEALECV